MFTNGAARRPVTDDAGAGGFRPGPGIVGGPVVHDYQFVIGEGGCSERLQTAPENGAAVEYRRYDRNRRGVMGGEVFCFGHRRSSTNGEF